MHQENFITVNNSNTDTIPVSKVQVATHEARILNDQNSKREPKADTCPQWMRPCKNETYSSTWTRKRVKMNDTAILNILMILITFNKTFKNFINPWK